MRLTAQENRAANDRWVTIEEPFPDPAAQHNGGRSAEARTTIAIDPAWKRDNVRIVAFVQERRGGPILASGVADLESPRPRSRDALRHPSP